MSSIWMVVWPQVSPSSSFICYHFITHSTASVNWCSKYPVFHLWSSLRYSLHLCLFFFQPVALWSCQTNAQGWTTGLAGAMFLPSSFVSRADRLKPCISSISLIIRREESGHCWKLWLHLCTAVQRIRWNTLRAHSVLCMLGDPKFIIKLQNCVVHS